MGTIAARTIGVTRIAMTETEMIEAEDLVPAKTIVNVNEVAATALPIPRLQMLLSNYHHDSTRKGVGREMIR